MKVIFFTLSILSVLCVSAILLAFAPYHFYNEAFVSGLKTPYITLNAPAESLVSGEEYNINQMNGLISESENLWETFHFAHMEFPLPVNHPQVLFMPNIKSKNFGLSLGGRFLDVKKNEIASFMLTETFPLAFSTKGQKIFNLPIYKKMILGTKKEELWNDIFELDISLPSKKGSYVDYAKELWKIPYEDLVYNLYILYIRKQIFPKSPLEISFYKDRNLGVIKTEKGVTKIKDEHLGEVDRYHEKYFFLEKGIVYTFSASFNKKDIIAESIRRKIVGNLIYRPSNEDASSSIYDRYNTLSYEEKITQQGLVYLYCAWSHVPKDENFMRKMIQFIERGKDNIVFLTPLYEYAYKIFGSNFSEKMDALREEESEKLKRKLKEELKSEIDEEANRALSGEELDFESQKEKIKFYLDDAKIKGSDADDNDDIITVE